MADDQDDSQKTEEPSQRKIDEAFRRGQVPFSREIGHLTETDLDVILARLAEARQRSSS